MKRGVLWLAGSLLLAGLAVTGLFALLRRQPVSSMLQDRIAWTSGASPSVAFVLDARHRLEYSVPGKSDRIRLMINASLQASVLEEGLSEQNPRRYRPFRLEIEELGFWRRSLSRREWNFVAQVVTYRDQGKLRSSLFFVDRDWVPSSTCEVTLEGLSSRGVKAFRMRILEADPGIFDLIVRAYSPTLGSDADQSHGWERLADPIRAQLLSGNVYPEGLLRAEEKQNLLAKSWQPLAPNSPWGSSPVQRQVYQVIGPMAVETGAAYKPHGLRVDPTRQAVVHIPMAGGRIRLRAVGWDTPQTLPAKPFLGLHWIGPGLGNRASRRVPWPGQALELEFPYSGGFLILETNRPGFVRAWLKTPQGEVEITPPAEALSCALLNPGQSVAYDLPPSDGSPVAFRLDVRQILDRPDPSTARTWLFRDQISARWPGLPSTQSKVRYEILDSLGRTIQHGRLPLDPWLSPFEDLPDSFAMARLSLPASTALLLPVAARSLRVSLEPDPHGTPPSSVLVSAFNRPQTLPHLRILPDDFFYFDTRETRLPEWFAHAPSRQEELIRDKRWIPVRTQFLPNAQEESLLSGLYELDPLEPAEPTLAREILAPRGQTGLQPREDGLGSYFREVRPGTECTVDFQARQGLRSLRPALLRIGPLQDAPVTVDGNGKRLAQTPVRASIQETLLPPLPPGKHRILLSSGEKGRYFLNHLWPGPGDWTRRLGYACRTGQTLGFRHERTDSQPETLTVGFLAPSNPEEEVVLRLKVVGATPAIGKLQSSLTRTERRFRVRTGPDPSAFLLAGPGTPLGVFPFASLTLGPDLPKGSYRIECTLESGPAGYMTITRSQAGLRPKSQVDQEVLVGATP